VTYRLSPEQAALYEEGGWPERRLTDDIIEWADRHHVTEPVVVTLDDGTILFAIAAGGRL
jgi:hypothetical protein